MKIVKVMYHDDGKVEVKTEGNITLSEKLLAGKILIAQVDAQLSIEIIKGYQESEEPK